MSKILFLSNHFIGLYAYRKELIRKLCESGHEVYLSLPENDENKVFEEMGCKIVITKIDRRGVNPMKDLNLIKQYKKMFKQINPDIIFSYTIKPNIYGTIASNRLGYKQVCNITGTGATFLKKNFLSRIAIFLYKRSVAKCYKVFFQNRGDKEYFVKNKMVKDNWAMLPGSGCNLEEHPYVDIPTGDVVRFIFIGRVMHLKGIDEYLLAAKKIKEKYPNTEFLIAGFYEEENYKSIVEEYERQGIVQYIGFRKDIGEWMAKCHCTVLPSHGGEGVPNVLLETAATGRACIGSNINGTKDVIDDGRTGYIFETGNADDLAKKMEQYVCLSQEEKLDMGIAGREKIAREFDREIVIGAYLEEVKEIGGIDS